MADTYSANIKVVLQQPGGNNNSWGTILNTNLDTIDAKFGDTTSISTTGGTTTLTETQEVVACISVTGALVANCVLVFSGRGGFWVISNGTTGNSTLTCKVSGQTGVTIDQGSAALVYCNGTDIFLGNPPPSGTAEATVASATTCNVLGASSEFVAISGTTTISSFGTGTNRKRFCRATGSFLITHDTVTLVCPGGSSITTAAGDTFILVSDASSNVRIFAYQRAAVQPSGVPIGAVTDFAGSAVPSFWLSCIGQAVSRTTYALLFSTIGTAYGSGNGVTTFNLPDLRGRVVAGYDPSNSSGRLTGAYTNGVSASSIANTGGAEIHNLTSNQNGSHTHPASASTNGAHTHLVGVHPGVALTGVGSGAEYAANFGNSVTTSDGDHTHTITVSSSGTGEAHNNVQPTIIMQKIIFAGV